MKKVTIFLPLLLILSLLQGCHGGSSTNSTSTLRLVNGDISTLDMYWSGSSSAAPAASGVPYGTASSGVSISAGNSSIAVINSGGIAPSGTNFSFSGGYDYTMVALPSYTTGQKVLQVKPLIDNQTTPVSGKGLLGVADYSAAGSLDVYVVASNGAPIPSDTTPWTLPGGTSGLTNYSPVTTGTTSSNFHIQVTGANAGPNNDVRLDIPSATIGSQQIMTLVLTPTTGGALVDGLLILQQGQNAITGQKIVTPYKNGSVRVRIATGGNAAATSASVNGTAILSSSLSPGSISAYVPVPLFNGGAAATPQPQAAAPAGAQTLSVTTNSGSCATTAMPGQDLTVLVVGSACYPIPDDNTLAPASYAKLRLVNGVNGSGSLTLGYNSGLYSWSASFGAAASAVEVPIPTGSAYTLSVSPWTGSTSWGSTSPALSQYGVYSVFLLGDTSAASAVLSTDHTYGP